jgi:hypothetical protein
MQESATTVPTLHGLPATLPRDGAVDLELHQGRLVFRISKRAQDRIEDLLEKQRNQALNASEEQELGQYEEIDDYLSFLNRLTHDLAANTQDSNSVS